MDREAEASLLVFQDHLNEPGVQERAQSIPQLLVSEVAQPELPVFRSVTYRSHFSVLEHRRMVPQFKRLDKQRA